MCVSARSADQGSERASLIPSGHFDFEARARPPYPCSADQISWESRIKRATWTKSSHPRTCQQVIQTIFKRSKDGNTTTMSFISYRLSAAVTRRDNSPKAERYSTLRLAPCLESICGQAKILANSRKHCYAQCFHANFPLHVAEIKIVVGDGVL